MPTPQDLELMRAAFRDVHAARLHGFALLVTLGDRPRASAAAGRALAEGSRRMSELRHPDRAAAWLRSRVLRRLSGGHFSASLGPLRALGVDDALLEALRELPVRERAALVASSVEGFDALDVATILGVSSVAARRLLSAARRRFATAYAAAPDDELRYGPLADRVLLVAARGFAPRPAARGPAA